MNALRTNKMASIFSTLTVALATAFCATGCVVSAEVDPGVYVDPGPAPVADIADLDIDPGASMSADPGGGVGVFVQYDAGGRWTVFTTCDTAVSGASCNFDIVVSTTDPRAVIDNVAGTDLDAEDSVALNADGSVNLVTYTSYGTNGMEFDVDPGATVEVDVLLDGEPQPQFVYAVSDGRLLNGVPSNPVDFTPVAP